MTAVDHIHQVAPDAPEDAWHTLGALVSKHRWPVEPLGMTDTDVLITDERVSALLESIRIEGDPVVLVDGQESGDVIIASDRVYVLLCRGERRRVRQLQSEYPDKTVVSVTYRNLSFVSQMSSLVAGREISLLAGMPCCGSDYLSRLMTENRLASVFDLFDEVTVAWAQCASDFEPARYVLAKIENIDAGQNKGRLCFRFDLELFERWRIENRVSPRKLRFLTQRANAKIIYMQRRNKSEQAIAASTYPAQSLLNKKLLPEAPKVSDIQNKALQSIAIETRFEMVLAVMPLVRMLTYEEAVSNPVEIVKMLANFFEMPGLKKVRVFDSVPYQLDAKWLKPFQREFKSAMLDYLGLEKNQYGSFARRGGLTPKP